MEGGANEYIDDWLTPENVLCKKLAVMYLCVGGIKPVNWVVMYLCVRGHVFVC